MKISLHDVTHTDQPPLKENRKETMRKIQELVGCVLWHINPWGLFNAKSYLYIYIKWFLYILDI